MRRIACSSFVPKIRMVVIWTYLDFKEEKHGYSIGEVLGIETSRHYEDDNDQASHVETDVIFLDDKLGVISVEEVKWDSYAEKNIDHRLEVVSAPWPKDEDYERLASRIKEMHEKTIMYCQNFRPEELHNDVMTTCYVNSPLGHKIWPGWAG